MILTAYSIPVKTLTQVSTLPQLPSPRLSPVTLYRSEKVFPTTGDLFFFRSFITAAKVEDFGEEQLLLESSTVIFEGMLTGMVIVLFLLITIFDLICNRNRGLQAR